MPRSSPLTARDKGFALVSRVNRWLIAGAVGLSVVLSVAAANAFHGRTRSESAEATRVVRQHPSSGGAGASNSGSEGLQSPAQAPAAASPPSGSGVVSGGS